MYLGKNVQTIQSEWIVLATETLKKALAVKFTRPAFRLALQQTQSIIGEATKHPVFGTGYMANEKQAYDCRTWTGENVMGLLLTELKSKICQNTDTKK